VRKQRKIWSRICLVALGALLILLPFAGCAPAPAENITFADLSWDSAQVHTRIAAFILENGYGYPPSDYIPGETIPLFVGLSEGDCDVSMEIWVENQQEAWDKALAEGKVVDLGINFPDAWQGWLVPTYMIEEGQIPADISVDKMPDYWELFKDPEDPTKGVFYSCIAGWECEKINEEKFEVYGLNDTYNVFLPGSGAALAANMVSAYEKHEPIFTYYWAPTWVLGKLDMTIVKEPPYNETVWETNHGCAYPTTGTSIAVNAEWAPKNEKAVEFLRNYSTAADQMNKVLAYMQENEASTMEAAIYFLKEYESVWTKWVPSDVAKKVKAALAQQ